MKLSEIKPIAEKYVKMFTPFCKRIEIAGSIRREKAEPNDIEIVCIPNDIKGFSIAVNNLTKIKGEPTGKYTQRLLPEGLKLDLFMATPENWGNILLIRTGDWLFSKQIMLKILRKGLKQKNGYLWDNNQIIECKEEEDIFKILGLNFIAPKDREKAIYSFR